jgi:dTDP-4-dehydrorhamnose reductase
MSSLLLIGAGGQLGTEIARQAPRSGWQVTQLTHAELDILDRAAVERAINDLRPDVVVNAAAFVNVERCEDEPERAFAVNADAVRDLAEATDAVGARLVHVSTDYVFNGRARSPYIEGDATEPLNVYGRSKLAGEEHVQRRSGRHLIVRSSGLYGAVGSAAKGGNFVSTMLRLGRERGEVSVVTDQVLGPTYTSDLATAMWQLIAGGAEGVYHATNAGSCSWHEFARAIFEMRGLNVLMHPIDSATLGSKAARPAYSVLSNAKLEAGGFGPMRPWREALAYFLAR